LYHPALRAPHRSRSANSPSLARVEARFQPYMEGLRGLMRHQRLRRPRRLRSSPSAHGGDFFPASQASIARPESPAVCLFFFMTGYLLWKGIIDRNPSSPAPAISAAASSAPGRSTASPSLFVFLFALWRTGFHLVVPLWQLALSFVEWLAFGLPMGAGNSINGIADVTSLGAGVFWSLQMDWVFYILLLGLVWFTRRRWRLALVIVPTAIIYMVMRPNQVQYHGALGRFGAFLTFFLWCFCFGMVGSVIKSKWPEWPWARTRSASALAVLIYVVLLCFMPPIWGRQNSLLIFPLFMLIAYGTDIFGLLSTPAAVFMGRISYSVYLFHALVLFSVVQALGPHLPIAQMGWLRFWLTISPIGLLAIGVATLSHRWIEMPMNILGRPRPASEAIPKPADATPAQVQTALQEEAAELPGMAEAEILLDPGVRK
jgi:peptidoglycan/LPS O-acetylase OafA/YrhL